MIPVHFQKNNIPSRPLVEGETLNQGVTIRERTAHGPLVDPPTEGPPLDLTCFVRTPSLPREEDPEAYAYGDLDGPERVSLGAYVLPLAFDEPGVWHIRWEINGERQGAFETAVTVRPSLTLALPGDTPS